MEHFWQAQVTVELWVIICLGLGSLSAGILLARELHLGGDYHDGYLAAMREVDDMIDKIQGVDKRN